MNKSRYFLLIFSLTLLTSFALPGLVYPQDQHSLNPDQEEPVADLYLTGDWGGFRQKMADKGVIFELVYTSEILKNMSGGNSLDYALVGNLDIILDADMEKLIGWTGGEIFIYVLGGHRSQDPSAIIGDVQASSNIEAGMDYFKLYSAWIMQSFFDHKLSLCLGLHDLNSEFYTNEPAGLFFNSSFGIGADFSQSGVNGPSIFPSTALAARIKAEPFENFYLMAVGYNAVAGDAEHPERSSFDLTFHDGFLIAAESGYEKEKDLKISVGGWIYTQQVPDITDPAKNSTARGLYLLFDKTLGAFSFFIRAGIADPNAFALQYNISEGITLSGSLWKRDDDQLGLAATSVIGSSVARSYVVDAGGDIDDHETAIELTYLLQITPWFSIQPDIQYIINPSLDPSLENALAISWRASISF